MADSTIPELPEAGPLNGTEPIETVQDSVSVQTPAQSIADLANVTSIEHNFGSSSPTITLSNEATSNHYAGVGVIGNTPFTSLTINSYPNPKAGALLQIKTHQPIQGAFSICNAFVGGSGSNIDPSLWILRFVPGSPGAWEPVIRIPLNLAGFLKAGDNVSQLSNDAGYITSGDIPAQNFQQVTDAGNITSNDIIVKKVDEIIDREIILFGDGNIQLLDHNTEDEMDINTSHLARSKNGKIQYLNFNCENDSSIHDLQERSGTLSHLDQAIGHGINNLSDVGEPTTSDDIAQGYVAGENASVWYYDGTLYVCVDNTEGAAVWESVGGGGSSGFAEVTKSEIDTLISNSELIPGATYHITDAGGTDGGVMVKAVSSNELELQGSGVFLNPDFQDVGNYDGVSDITGISKADNLGIWYLSGESGYGEGDIVFWNGLHYQVTDNGAVDGTNPETNTSAYTLLPKSAENVGYIREIAEVKYHIEFDNLSFYYDKRGNRVYNLTDGESLLADQISVTQKGNNLFIGNFIDTPANQDIPTTILITINQRGEIYGCNFSKTVDSVFGNERPYVLLGAFLSGNIESPNTTESYVPLSTTYGSFITNVTNSVYYTHDIDGLNFVDCAFCGIVIIDNTPSGNILSFINYRAFGNIEIRPNELVTFESTPFADVNSNGAIIGSASTWTIDGNKREVIEVRREIITNTNGTFEVARVIGGNNNTL